MTTSPWAESASCFMCGEYVAHSEAAELDDLPGYVHTYCVPQAAPLELTA